MEISEVQKLFTRIRQLHPNTPPEKVPKLTQREAKRWADSLSGYSLDQVLIAAERHADTCRFWPELSEIKAQLPLISEAERRRYAPPTPSELRSMEQLRAWQAEWRRELREKGLPSLHEALEAGMTPGEWSMTLCGAGVFREEPRDCGGG